MLCLLSLKIPSGLDGGGGVSVWGGEREITHYRKIRKIKLF